MAYKDPQDPRAKAARRKHYQNNKEAYLERARAQRKELDLWHRQLKSEPCTDCGGKFHWCAMDFDHLGDEDKVLNVNIMVSRGFARDRILAEIAKCELVCANCHRVRTWNRLMAVQRDMV